MQLDLNTAAIYPFLLVSSVDFVTPVLGAVPTIKIGKQGAGLVAATNPGVERGLGWYEVTFTAAEMNTLGGFKVDIQAATAAPWRDVAEVIAPGAGNGSIAFTYTVTNSVTMLPLDGVQVTVTTDLAGQNVVARGTADAFGVVVFYLDAGTYQFWSVRSGYTFTNPDQEIVS